MNELEMDTLIEETLRGEPLSPAPSVIYPFVMAAVRRDELQRRHAIRPAASRFRVTWLDAALSLFGALMAGIVWVMWGLFQSSEAAPWLDYLGLLARLNLQRAIYADRGLLLAAGLGLGAVSLAAIFVWVSCKELGICVHSGERI